MEKKSSSKHNADWYIAILDAINDMVLVKGDRSKLLWANRAFLDYYGMSNEELEDIIDAPHSDPDDTIQYVKDDHYVFTTGNKLDIPSEPVTNADGETSYFHTIKTAILDEGQHVERTVGVSRLISSDEVIRHSELARSEQKSSLNELRLLVREIPLAVAMLDVKQRFLCNSQQWSNTFKNESELSGQFFQDTSSNELPISDFIDEVVASGKPTAIHAIEILGQGNKPFIIDVDIHPWFLPSRDVGGTIILAHDVTEAKRSEANLKRLNDELMQFNYRVSHDLLAPLRSLRGYLNICQEELHDNPDMVEDIHGKMISSVDNLSDLVQNLLNLARADVRDETKEEVNLKALIQDVLDTHKDEIQAIDLNVHIELEQQSYYCSHFRLRQIIENFVSNSIKYYDPDETNKTLSITASEQEHTMCLQFADNGIGFEENLTSDIFNMFVRGSSKHPGSGLGLYLVKKHADNLGGKVSVISNSKQTVFEIALPKGGAHHG